MKRALRVGFVAQCNGILNALQSNGVRFWMILVLMMMSGGMFGQTWTYDFGTGTGTHPTSTISTTFLTSTPSGGGVYRVRTGSGGGTILLANPGTTLGTSSELQIQSSTSAATNKFGVYDWTSPSTVGYLKAKVRSTSTGTGSLNISLGINTVGNDNNGYTSHYNNSLASLTIAYASGAVSSVVRRASGSNTTIASSGFAKDTNQQIELYANNGASSANYVRGATTYTLPTKTWDIWLDGVRIVNNGATAGTLAAGVNLSGFGFFSETSASNAAYLYLDDLEYSNTLPTVVVPTISTTTASAITTTGASSGGNVTADGGATVSARGVYFGTTATPATGTSDGTGTGSFSSSLSSLSVNTKYFYRAYATNSAGTGYGTESSFFTLANVPSAPTVATPTSTSLNVSITSGDGNPASTEYAIHETSTNQFLQANGSLGAAAVWQTAATWGTKTITPLTPSTSYTFETKARNGANTETSYSITAGGTTLANATLDFCNLQFPTSQTIVEGSTFNVYAQAYKGGLTEAAGQAAGLSAWIGYSSSNTNPNGGGWTWVAASFNVQSGNNDEFVAALGAGLAPGTYYYASRFQLGSGTYSYGGTAGTWSSDSGVLTVNPNIVGFANIQSPFSGTIAQGGAFNVYAKVYKSGVTDGAGQGAGINGWIGYSTTNATTEADFASWTWVAATYNVDALNDDEYVANIGTSLAVGTYYYVSRFQVAGSVVYKYGGINNNFWNAPANSGVLTVQTPREINIKQGVTNIASTGTYAFASQTSGTSSSAITFTVENTGQQNLSVDALSITGTNASEFSITQVSGTLPLIVGGVSTTTFTVTFSPTSTGAKTAQLSLINNDANENPYLINLTGTAGAANDNCAGAISLTVNAAATAGTLVASSPQSGFTENDVWYSFIPTCTGSHSIAVGGFTGADLDIQVYATNCPVSSAATKVTLTGGTSSSNPEVGTATFTGGTTYYVRVFKYAIADADSNFTIQITTPALGTPTSITASPTTFCSGATVTFTATAVTNASSYTWTVPSDWTINSTTSNTMSATVGAIAGAVTAKAVNCYGEGTQKSQNFTPGVIPATPGSITGNATTCIGTSSLYSITAVAGATSYTWTLPSGWSGTSTTTSITATAGATGGNITVTANSTCGSSSAQTLPVTVSTLPATPSVPTSNSPQCLPTGVTASYAGTAPAGEVWYWQTLATGTDVASVNSAVTYNVTTPGTSTIYLRSLHTTSGCWSTASNISVTVNPITAITTQPANKSISVGSSATFTVSTVGSGLTYQWQVDKGSGFANVTIADGTNGTTAAFTTVTATDLSMSGYKYRVIITGSCGNVTSDGSATLTISVIVYNIGDYRSITNGTWHSTTASGTATWEEYTGSGWSTIGNPIPGTTAASLGTKKVYINTNISLVGTNSAPYVIVLDDGELHSNVTVTFGNLLVKSGGEFYRENNATGMNSLGVFEIEDGGTAYITQTNLVVPTIWAGTEKFHPNSNVVIKRLDSETVIQATSSFTPFTDVNGNSAYFGNLIIDSSVDMSILDGTTGVAANANRITNGDLILRSGSGTSAFRFVNGTGTTSTTAVPYIVGGNFIIESGFTGTASLRSGSVTTHLKVNKDFIMNGASTFRMTGTSGITTAINLYIDGNIKLNDTSIFLFSGNVSNPSPILSTYLKGDIIVASGATFTNLNTAANNNANLYFANNGDGTTDVLTQTIDIAPTTGSNAKINYSLIWPATPSIPYVKLAKDLYLGINSLVNVRTNASLDFGFNGTTANNILKATSATGTSFTQQTGSNLYITSPNGITTGGLGNVQTDTRTYATNTPFADYHYIGKVDQATGDGLPETVRNLTIKNAVATSDVNITNAAVKVNGTLTMEQGNIVSKTSNLLHIGSSTLIPGSLTYISGVVKDLGGASGVMRRWFDGSSTGETEGLFPLGTTTNHERFITMEFAGATGGYLDATFVAGTPMGLAGVTALSSIPAVGGCDAFTVLNTDENLFWSVTPEIGKLEDGTHNVTLRKESAANICKQTVLKRNTAVADWRNPGTHVAGTIKSDLDISVKRDGMTGLLKDFGIGDGYCSNTTIMITTSAWTGAGATRLTPVEVNNTITLPAGISRACECLVASGVTVIIPDGATLEVVNGITLQSGANPDGSQDGKIIIENNGSLVQLTDVDNATNNNNTGTIKMYRITQPMYRYDYTYWGSPVTGTTLHDLSPDTLGDKYFWWDPLNGWTTSYNGAESMVPGKGYIIRAPQTFSTNPLVVEPYGDGPGDGFFQGVPNNGIIKRSVASGDGVYNLIGNPYPSAMDAIKFIDGNLSGGNGSIEGTLYFWTHNTPVANLQYSANDYATFNKSGGTATHEAPSDDDAADNSPNGFIAAGQAFFVEGNTTQEVLFNNGMRAAGSNNQFFKPGPPQPIENWEMTGKHRVWLNLKNAQTGFNQALVGYMENATNDYDLGYDGKSFGGNQVMLYSLNDDKKLTIQARALPFSNQDEVPLGYKTTLNGTLKISIDHFDGLFEGQAIYLEDQLLNIVHDLKESDYSFTSAVGTFNDRFVLRYLPSEELSNPDPENSANGLIVYQEENKILIQSQLENLEQIKVYDLLGRVVYDKAGIGAKNWNIENVVMQQQPLIVKIQLQNGQVVEKKILY